MGGYSIYDLAILDFSERLVEDPNLHHLYGKISWGSLCQMQREVLDLALIDMNQVEKNDAYIRIMLYHYRLFSWGLTNWHFHIMREHLFDVLLHLLVEPDVRNDIVQFYDEFQSVLFGRKRVTDGSLTDEISMDHIMNVHVHITLPISPRWEISSLKSL